MWILLFPIGVLEVSTWKNEVFDIISVLNKFTNQQARETLYYIPRGGNTEMWKTCFPAPQNTKKEHQLKHKNHVRNGRFIDS